MHLLIQATGCEVVLLPAYSPDLSPVDEAPSRIKSRVRAAGARTWTALDIAIAAAWEAITAADAAGWSPTPATELPPLRQRDNRRAAGTPERGVTDAPAGGARAPPGAAAGTGPTDRRPRSRKVLRPRCPPP
jgi:hypothetical protein